MIVHATKEIKKNRTDFPTSHVGIVRSCRSVSGRAFGLPIIRGLHGPLVRCRDIGAGIIGCPC